MRIVFYPLDCTPFHGLTLLSKPIGGTETAVIHLAEALDALGHEVIVISQIANPPNTRPIYLPKDKLDQIEDIDVFITVRGWLGVFKPIKSKKKFLWTGDSYANRNTIGMGDKRFINEIDGLLCVSNWHAKTLCSASGIPLDKTFVIGNGVDLKDFEGSEQRQRKRLIYTSNPQRGLIYFVYIFGRLKLLYPDVELHIFSNSAMFDMEWPPKFAMDVTHESLLRSMASVPGCFVHGTVLQKQLAREYMKSDIWAYPCKVEETCCISALEAQAAGCAIVTSAIGALEETVGNAGILIKEKPGSEEFLKKFVESLELLLTNDEAWMKLSNQGLSRIKDYDWKKIAAKFLEFLKNQHRLA